MSDIAIRVQGLGKRYRIGGQKAPYKTLRESLVSAVTMPVRWLKGERRQTASFWALEDVSFEVQRGSAVGIIGRNGAGKSTLLKILSRITRPTRGRMELFGRVGSLLEVGTGFHPELTGRENISLNGAILGMTRAEINRRFDEIVAFAEVEKFLDTPVKFYSSGMYVRLAFAVAAHLEPEILLVDEVLAVGDAAFQKKCLGKMDEVAHKGLTVLFVSHNMSAIKNLCAKAIYLESGSVVMYADTEAVINKYLADIERTIVETPLVDRKDRQGSGQVRVVDFYAVDEQGKRQPTLMSGHDYSFVMEYEKMGAGTEEEMKNLVGSIGIEGEYGQFVLLFRSNFTNQNFDLSAKSGRILCDVKDLNLAPGVYNVAVFLSRADVEILDWLHSAAQIIVEGGNYYGTGSIGYPSMCKVLSRANWRVLP